MKRIISFFLILFLCGAISSAEGIGSYKDLVEFAAASNAGKSTEAWKDADGVVRLTSDIDMSKVKKFGGILSFGGKFDGAGHSILNWKASGGLFSRVLEGGEVRNLVIGESCSMKASGGNSEFSVGFIADENEGLIENCENRGSISHRSGYTEKEIYLGGIVGVNRAWVLSCRNFGKIESKNVGARQVAELSINVGGVAGGGALKTLECPVFARCENWGEVSLSADFPVCNVGGVVGCAFKVPMKYCVNRGKVSSSTLEPESASLIPQSRLGGIAGMAKGDIMCCDNFGEVLSSGSHFSVTGGICGMPHASIVVGDCVNYATVRLSNERQSFVGGIAGSVNRPVHIRGCINRGDVVYEGFSPDRRSACGGIVGSVSVKKDAKEGAYVRCCANYGAVSSGSGGNNYENSDKALHTGGIAGWINGSDIATVMLKDCSNFGKVTYEGGRGGNLCGACVKVQTGGEYSTSWAETAEPLSDGSNVFGRVTDSEGNPVPGVVVSDGFQSVRTDGYGYYSMRSDLSLSRFVQISFPSDYEIDSPDGRPSFFRRIARGQKAVMANFTLSPRPDASDKFTLLMIADPQMRPFGVDNSAEAYRDAVIPDAEALRKSVGGECYSIDLGDLVYNYLTAFDDYLDITQGLGCLTFNVMGNHDFDQTTLFDTSLGTMHYETYAGPLHYSFNIGKLHFVILDDIVYNRTSPSQRYGSGLEKSALEWLKSDLSFVPTDTPIVVCAHSQMFKKRSSHSTHALNYPAYRDLLSRYEKVYSWAGHNHENYYYDYAGKDKGLDNISCITVSRCTGALRLNKYLNSDGTPQGYIVATVDGKDMKWYYKAVGREGSYQMKVYPPSRTDGAKVVANIWNYGDNWSSVEWWENGEKVSSMRRTEMEDPDYVDLFAGVKNATTRKYCAPTKSQNMFEVLPSDNVRSGEVRVTDNFGVTYISKIQW